MSDLHLHRFPFVAMGTRCEFHLYAPTLNDAERTADAAITDTGELLPHHWPQPTTPGNP